MDIFIEIYFDIKSHAVSKIRDVELRNRNKYTGRLNISIYMYTICCK